MGMQYVIAKCHIDKSSTNGKLRAETINSYGHADVEVGKAHKNGAKIEAAEIRTASALKIKPAVWFDCPDPRWWWGSYNYRVKQEPIVRWGILDAEGDFIGTYADEVCTRQAVERYYPGGRVIKLVEE